MAFNFFKVATVVLSITAKQKKKDQDKKKDASEKMDVDDEKKDTEKEKDKKEEEVKKDEPTFEIIDNPARVMKAQLQVKQLTSYPCRLLRTPLFIFFDFTGDNTRTTCQV